MKGQYHKAVGFAETREDIGETASKLEETIQTGGTKELNSLHVEGMTGAGTNYESNCEIESKLNQLMKAWAK